MALENEQTKAKLAELRAAIADNDQAKVSSLLAVLPKEVVDARDDSGQTALHLAADKGEVGVVKALLSAMSPEAIGAQDSLGSTALHVAANNDHADIVNALLPAMSQEAIDTKDNNGWTALHFAAGAGHIDSVNALLPAMSQKAVDSQNDVGLTALHLAVSEEQMDEMQIDIVNALLPTMSQEAIDAKDNDDWTALHFAGSEGYINCVLSLLAAQKTVSQQVLTTLFICLSEEDIVSVLGVVKGFASRAFIRDAALAALEELPENADANKVACLQSLANPQVKGASDSDCRLPQMHATKPRDVTQVSREQPSTEELTSKQHRP